MDSLSISDSDGDRFRLEARDGVAVAEINDSYGMLIGSDGAQAIVDWLTEHFGLTRELTALVGMDPGLEINVETETGKTRMVRWYGPDVPAQLVKLAEVALRVYDRGADVTPDEARPEPKSLAVLRQVMATLGLERVDGIPARVEKLTGEINAVAAALASASGTTIGPDGVSLPSLVLKLRQQHGLEIARLKAVHYDTLQQTRAEHASHEQGLLARERDVRAAVQVELDVAVRQGQAAREALELAEETGRVLAAKLEKARGGLEYARAQYYTPEEEIGEARWDAGVSRAIVAGIDGSLRDSDPEA